MAVGCKKCGVACTSKMLHRTNPTGQSDGGWMCLECIESEEPELYKNIVEDEDFNVFKDIEDALKDL